MPKHFVLVGHNFTPKQLEEFEDFMSEFFEDVMCDGRSRASYEMHEIRKGTEIVVNPPKRQKS